MKRPSRAKKVTPMNEVVPAETVVFVEFLPLSNKSPIVAQSFLFFFFSRETENLFPPQMLATNLINK